VTGVTKRCASAARAAKHKMLLDPMLTL